MEEEQIHFLVRRQILILKESFIYRFQNETVKKFFFSYLLHFSVFHLNTFTCSFNHPLLISRIEEFILNFLSSISKTYLRLE
jgi:hypothetical protein